MLFLDSIIDLLITIKAIFTPRTTTNTNESQYQFNAKPTYTYANTSNTTNTTAKRTPVNTTAPAKRVYTNPTNTNLSAR